MKPEPAKPVRELYDAAADLLVRVQGFRPCGDNVFVSDSGTRASITSRPGLTWQEKYEQGIGPAPQPGEAHLYDTLTVEYGA